jgi:hypothetical protein
MRHRYDDGSWEANGQTPPKPPRFPLHWVVLAAIVAAAVATAAVGLAK